MLPVLLRWELPLVGPVEIQTYGVAAVVALVAGWSLARRDLERAGIDPIHAYWSAVFLLPAMTVGAKILPWIQNPAYRAGFAAAHEAGGLPAALIGFNLPGGSLLSAALAGGLAALAYARFYDLPVRRCVDAVSPGLALAIPIMRLGCLSAGCCYGTATSLPWGVVFTDAAVSGRTGVPLGVALHPVQLYEALLVAALAAALAYWRPRRRREGELGVLLIGGYAVIRLLVEFARADVIAGPHLGPLTATRVVAASLLLLAAAWLAQSRRTPDSG